jgi:hypothetical protein
MPVSGFKNDLYDRTQCISADGAQSNFLNITKGAPQGSILGPLLFTFYMNNVGFPENLQISPGLVKLILKTCVHICALRGT